MAKKTINDSTLTSIASAIRAKLGVETEYKPTQMPSAIQSIETPAHKELSITANGVYEPPTGYNGFDRVTANVPSAEPTGHIDITNMQVVDVSDYATAQVVDSDLVAGNIKKDIDILGIVGTFEGGGGGASDNDLLFHFADFKNSGKMNAVFYNKTGYEISDEQSKFGGTSLKVKSAPATGGAVYFDSGFTIGTEDFTLDFWMYQTNTSSTNCVISFNYRSLGFYTKTGTRRGIGVAKVSSSWVISGEGDRDLDILNGWHHVAITREDGALKVFVDGIQEESYTFADSFPTMTRLSFGTNSTGDTSWRGYIDEFRLKLGEAVWTENFTPPTQPYS